MQEETIKSVDFDKIKEQLEDLCITEGGKFIARSLLPYSTIELAEKALKETTQARNFYEREGTLPFLEFVGIYPIIERIKVLSPISGKELLKIASVLETIGEIKHIISLYKDDFPLLFAYSNSLKNFKDIVSKIRLSVGSDGRILDNASPLLSIIRREMRTIRIHIQTILEKIIYSKQYETIIQEQIITKRNDRYVIPIKQSGRTNFPCVIQDRSSSGLTLFVEPLSIVELNNKLQELSFKEKQEEERIIIEIEKSILNRVDDLIHSLGIIEKLDFAFAKGRLSILMDGSEPKLTSQRKITILQGRHPFIPKNRVVPIDLEVGDKYHMLIITGPNTGGKTVTLKTVGLFVLMAESGLHIPAYSNSEIGFFKEVFADIGDEQSIQQSLSTFSSHIGRIIHILLNANKDSLVLLDELGAGTDPEEGSALGYAILKDLYNRDIITLASTHHSRLKEFPYEFPLAQNASVGFDVDTLKPTYRLYIGVAGGSHAFVIAKKLGIPERVLESAKQELSNEQGYVQEMISKMSVDRKKLIESQENAEKTWKEVEELKRQYNKKLEELDKKKKEEIKRAYAEAQKIVESTQRRMNDIIRNLENYIKSQRAIQQAKKEVEAKKEEVNSKVQEIQKKSKPFSMEDIEEGAIVYVPNFGKHGIVLKKLEDKKKIVVQVGGIRATVSPADVEKQKESDVKKEKPVEIKNTVNMEVPMKLDLHGYTVEEAIDALDKYLDSAYLVGLPFVYIIHGKGTGALRKAVFDFLKKNPHVSNFYTGTAEEGGIGVTIAYLK